MKRKKTLITSTVLFIPIIIIILIAVLLLFNFDKSLNFFSNLFGLGYITNEEKLKNSRSWIIDINFKDNDDLEKIINSSFDTVVVDISDVDKEGVEKVKKSNDKLVLCYINIGQAESFRDYWQVEWNEDKPDWIKDEDAYWGDNFNIDFSSQEWKDILLNFDNSYLNTIFLNNYDGVYLDITGVDYWESIGDDKEEDMIQLIEEISDFANSKNSHFLIVLQNIASLEGEYSNRLNSKIDGIAQEELYFGYENRDGQETPVSVTRSLSSKIDKYKDDGKPVFILDYPFICLKDEKLVQDESCYDIDNIKRMRSSYSSALDNNYIMYCQNRQIRGVTYSIPVIHEIEVSYDNLPILSWKSDSGNSNDPQSAYRIYISSTQEKCENDEADIYDSGKIWSGSNFYDLIIDREVESGEYFWKAVIYEQIDGTSLISPWSQIGSLNYDMEEINLDAIDISDRYQTAWIPNWAFGNGFESLKAKKDKFDSISPVWFKVDEEGELKRETNHNDDEFMNFCSENGIDLIPSIPIFDPEIVSKILNHKMDSHIEAIIDEVKDGDYAGIDIDYEATYLSDKELFLELIKQLSIKLHSNGKMLSLTVLSKWTEEDIYGWLPETRQVQDWRNLEKYIDEMRIMAYDYSSQNSYISGPMSPIYWDNLILKYAKGKISEGKIVLALPLYGYSFRIDEKSNIGKDIYEGGEIYGSERRVLAYTYEEILEIGNDFEFEYNFDEFSSEMIIGYNDGNYERKLYFLSHDSIMDRKRLAEKYDIKGIAYWRLGGDIGNF